MGLALTGALWYATTLLDIPTGFAAQYFAGTDASAPALVSIDARVSSAVVRTKWVNAAAPFKVRWDAVLRIQSSGTYRFSVVSDDGAQLFLDNRVVIDTRPGLRQTTVPVSLEGGVHPLRLEYQHTGGDPRIELLWSSSLDGGLTPLTGIAVSPTARTRSDFQRGRGRELIRLGIIAIWTLGYWLLGARVVVIPLWRALVRHHMPEGVPSAVLAWLACVAVIYGVGIGWGWPGPGWVPNELSVTELFNGVGDRFSGGWWSWYGPVHFYLLTLVSLPLYLWQSLDGDAFYQHLGFDLVLLIFRVVSVAMAVGGVLMIYICGLSVSRRSPLVSSQQFDWPAFVAAAVASLSMPMVFYAKAANMDMPYLFWFSVSLASLARIAAHDSKRDYVLFAVAGMLAVGTKDQAYGLYGLPALGVAVHAYRREPGRTIGAKLSAFVRDRWVLGALAAGLGTFALTQNLAANWAGFLTHFRYIQTGGIDGFRMFDLNANGLWQLWRASWMLIRVSVGWPAFVLILAGLALSLRPWHGRLWWLLLPAISYFVTYAVVVRYTYDRFLLPVLLMLALAAGVAAAAVEAFARGARWTRLVTGSILVYSLTYVLAVDVAMTSDSRYRAERWLRANVAPGSRIGLVGGPEYMPRIEGFFGQVMRPTPGELESASFDYIVLNLDWVKRFPPERPESGLFAALREGGFAFRPVFQHGADTRVGGMRFLDRFTPFGEVGFSTLTKIDPPLVIFKRMP